MISILYTYNTLKRVQCSEFGVNGRRALDALLKRAYNINKNHFHLLIFTIVSKDIIHDTFALTLKELSMKVTPRRLAILDIMYGQPVYISPEEILGKNEKEVLKNWVTHCLP